MRPTIITGMPEDAACMKEEIFGPVTCVAKFTDYDDAISRANNVRYGLCACVYTNDLSKAHKMAHQLQVST